MSNNNYKETIARIGIATKGFVYILIGGLTAMAAYGYGGKKTGSGGAFEWLQGQPIGQVLLILTAVGIGAYVFWRMYQTFVDPENKGSDAHGIGRRAGYFSSGLFYVFVAYEALSLAIGNSSGSGGGQESLVAFLLSNPYGQVFVAVVATIFLGKSLWQFYRAWSGKYRDSVKESDLSESGENTVVLLGKIGYAARGIVVAIIAYLTYRAAFYANSSGTGGATDAFHFLQNELGAILFGIIALGLAAYGVFMLIKAYYREMHSV